jgi:hypothetical protein
MPTTRNRRSRHRGSAAEVAAWSAVFEFGRDFFGELRQFGGVAVDAYGCVERQDAAAAWSRLGATFLQGDAIDPRRQPWAVSEFGWPAA